MSRLVDDWKLQWVRGVALESKLLVCCLKGGHNKSSCSGDWVSNILLKRRKHKRINNPVRQQTLRLDEGDDFCLIYRLAQPETINNVVLLMTPHKARSSRLALARITPLGSRLMTPGLGTER